MNNKEQLQTALLIKEANRFTTGVGNYARKHIDSFSNFIRRKTPLSKYDDFGNFKAPNQSWRRGPGEPWAPWAKRTGGTLVGGLAGAGVVRGRMPRPALNPEQSTNATTPPPVSTSAPTVEAPPAARVSGWSPSRLFSKSPNVTPELNKTLQRPTTGTQLSSVDIANPMNFEGKTPYTR
jgi:hypothetical protein